MSLTVSSTTDDQAAVNAAAGLEPEQPEAQPQDAGKPVPPPPPEQPEPDENGEEEPDQEPEPEEPHKAKGGFQRKIEKLSRQNDYAAQRIQELEWMLRQGMRDQAPQNGKQPQPAPQEGPPRQDQFDDFDQYWRAHTRWEAREAVRQELAQAAEQHAKQQQQAAEQQRISGWHERVGQFSTETPDFYETLESVSHIPVPQALQEAITQDPMGPRLAYELARQPEEFKRIAALDRTGALIALGEFRAAFAKQAAPRNAKPAVSQAPAPIRPVGQGASGNSTVPLDQMSYQDFKRARERQIAARRNK